MDCAHTLMTPCATIIYWNLTSHVHWAAGKLIMEIVSTFIPPLLVLANTEHNNNTQMRYIALISPDWMHTAVILVNVHCA